MGPPLSQRAQALLRRLPAGQFVFSSSFPSLEAALEAGPGWVDLFSGGRGVAKAISSAAPWWALCYDLHHDSEEDLASCEVQEAVVELFRSGAAFGFSVDPPAGTFSTALVPPWRSAEHPEGLPALTPLQRDRVDRENNLAIFCAKLSAACEAAGLTYAVSNPLRSRMWRLPCWRRLLEPGRTFSVDFCRFSTPWRKATRIATNGQRAGQSLRCMHEGAHRALRDRCPKRGVNWTSLAEPFPRRLCSLLGAALAQDAGLFPDRRRLDIARCAKVGQLRVGEAPHPGPRSMQPRTPACLSEVELVEPRTAAVRDKHWSAFLTHLQEGLGSAGAESVWEVPALLVAMLCALCPSDVRCRDSAALLSAALSACATFAPRC